MKFLKRLFPAVAVALAAGPALAAVTGSHHDLTAFQAGATESCLYCHGVLKAGTASTEYGNVGDLCLSRCHVGGAFVTDTRVIPNIPASIDQTGTAITAKASVNAVRTDTGYGHGLTKSVLVDPILGTTADTFTSAAAGFPYQGNTSIECTTCHNVHDNTNTPFLQANLFTGGTAARTSFCEACHSTRGNSWAGGVTAPNGEHPTNFALVLTTVTRGTVGGTGASSRRERYINLDGNVFDEATANGTGLNGLAGQYVTGGKVGTWANASGAAGETFGCYTCHGVHVPTIGPTGHWQAPNLILRDATSTDGTWNPICVGCHGREANGVDDPNPGLTAYYHPVGSGANAGSAPVAADGVGTGTNVYEYTASTGAFKFSVSLNALKSLTARTGPMADTVVGVETTSHRPRCGSCHDVHGGLTDSMALVDIIGARDGASGGAKICDSCHNGVGLPDMSDSDDSVPATNGAGEPANSHHRTRTGTWATATVTDTDGDTLNLDSTNSASWLTAADHTNGLDCADCHVFDGTVHSTAHNW